MISIAEPEFAELADVRTAVVVPVALLITVAVSGLAAAVPLAGILRAAPGDIVVLAVASYAGVGRARFVSLQFFGLPLHIPVPVQCSFTVHGSWSTQETLPVTGSCAQPEIASHQSIVQGLESSHRDSPTHCPAASHLSFPVHEIASLQSSPGLGVCLCDATRVMSLETWDLRFEKRSAFPPGDYDKVHTYDRADRHPDSVDRGQRGARRWFSGR